MTRDCKCPLAAHRHGTRAAYCKDSCRCFPCRVAHSRAVARANSGGGWAEGLLVDRCGVRRRLEALHALGWSERALADRLRVSKQAVRDMRCHEGRATFALRARVSALYEQLWDQAPAGQYVSRTLNWAARQGFVPPMGWDDHDLDDPAASPSMGIDSGDLDWVLVQRIIDGQTRIPVHTQSPERVEAVRRLAAAGYTDVQIGQRIGARVDAVLKVRHRHGMVTGVSA